MWQVFESHRAVKQLRRCPREVLKEYEAWKKVVELTGPSALRKITGYCDHSLKGEWTGARSSYLNKKWRVIYAVDKNKIVVKVFEVNPHDYRKKV